MNSHNSNKAFHVSVRGKWGKINFTRSHVCEMIILAVSIVQYFFQIVTKTCIATSYNIKLNQNGWVQPKYLDLFFFNSNLSLLWKPPYHVRETWCKIQCTLAYSNFSYSNLSIIWANCKSQSSLNPHEMLSIIRISLYFEKIRFPYEFELARVNCR